MDNPAVMEYGPKWPGLFEGLRGCIDAALTSVAHVTEHVGSTAVPGLDAKPIVDLDVVVPGDTGVDPGDQGEAEMITEFLRLARRKGTNGPGDVR